VIIHVHPGVAWQVRILGPLTHGLWKAGLTFRLTASRTRIDGGMPILLGTTFWNDVEPGGPFILVDRCSFGDPDRWVTLVRDGHGRRGDHRVPSGRDGSRWERVGTTIEPWSNGKGAVVLCGQCRTWSPIYRTVSAWYEDVVESCTHFRRHPAARAMASPSSVSALPVLESWDSVGRMVTLNSSIAVDAVLRGIPTVAMDEGSMAWEVTGRHPGDIRTFDRKEWLHWLAWTQWHWDEIGQGAPLGRLL